MLCLIAAMLKCRERERERERARAKEGSKCEVSRELFGGAVPANVSPFVDTLIDLYPSR
jgi:hypothetical protein